jgi:hypothetical protein
MNKRNNKKDSIVFKAECPCCGSLLWIDSTNKEVIRFDRKKKKRGSLDDLLLKERKRKAGFEARFESTAELARERQKEAQKKYREALKRLEKTEDED